MPPPRKSLSYEKMILQPVENVPKRKVDQPPLLPIPPKLKKLQLPTNWVRLSANKPKKKKKKTLASFI